MFLFYFYFLIKDMNSTYALHLLPYKTRLSHYVCRFHPDLYDTLKNMGGLYNGSLHVGGIETDTLDIQSAETATGFIFGKNYDVIRKFVDEYNKLNGFIERSGFLTPSILKQYFGADGGESNMIISHMLKSLMPEYQQEENLNHLTERYFLLDALAEGSKDEVNRDDKYIDTQLAEVIKMETFYQYCAISENNLGNHLASAGYPVLVPSPGRLVAEVILTLQDVRGEEYTTEDVDLIVWLEPRYAKHFGVQVDKKFTPKLPQVEQSKPPSKFPPKIATKASAGPAGTRTVAPMRRISTVRK